MARVQVRPSFAFLRRQLQLLVQYVYMSNWNTCLGLGWTSLLVRHVCTRALYKSTRAAHEATVG